MFGKLTLTLRVTLGQFCKKLLIKTVPQRAGQAALIPPPTSLPVMKSSMWERVSAVFTLIPLSFLSASCAWEKMLTVRRVLSRVRHVCAQTTVGVE